MLILWYLDEPFNECINRILQLLFHLAQAHQPFEERIWKLILQQKQILMSKGYYTVIFYTQIFELVLSIFGIGDLFFTFFPASLTILNLFDRVVCIGTSSVMRLLDSPASLPTAFLEWNLGPAELWSKKCNFLRPQVKKRPPNFNQ